MELSRIEKEVMEQILRGDYEGVEIAKAQYASAMVSDRKCTGVDFYASLSLPETVEKLPDSLSLRQAFFNRASASVTTDSDELTIFHLCRTMTDTSPPLKV